MPAESPPPSLPREPSNPRASPAERELDDLEVEVLEHYFQMAPTTAVFLGLHAYDGFLPDLSERNLPEWIRKARDLLDRLARIDALGLPSRRRLDRDLLTLDLESLLFDLTDYPYPEKLPLWYVAPLSLVPYTTRSYAPPPIRAGAMIRILRGAPSLLRTGLTRLRPPLPAPFVGLSLAMFRGLPEHFTESEAFVRDQAPDLLGEYREAREAARESLAVWERFLKEALGSSTPEFALGPERYQRLLKVREGLTQPWASLLEEGWRDLRRNQDRLGVLSRSLVPPRDPPSAIRSLAPDHPDADRLLAEAREFVREVRQFTVDQDLVTIPGPDACRVEPTPPMERALSTASMNPPGPFEKSLDEGIYYVTTVDPAWEPKQQEEWLQYFNRPLFRNVTAHEVYPGHYLQFLHFRAGNPTLTAKTFFSPSFVEGWAHYAEQLMVEAGYRSHLPQTEIAQLQDALLRDVRLIVSASMHARGMTLEEATRLFQTEAYLDRFPAEREAIRGTYNPEYFCYTLGKLKILAAREAWRKRNAGVPLREFHDRLLSFGCPPVGLLEPLVLGEELPDLRATGG